MQLLIIELFAEAPLKAFVILLKSIRTSIFKSQQRDHTMGSIQLIYLNQDDFDDK